MNATVAATGIERALLICGLIAVALFPITDLLGRALWKGYNPVAWSISELGVQGAPTRRIIVPLELLRDLPKVAFAVGVWRVSLDNVAARVMAGLLFANAVSGALGFALFPMRIESSGTFAVPPANLATMATSMFCFVLAILAGAIAFPGRFRSVSIASLAFYAVATLVGLYVARRLGTLAHRVTVGLPERTMVAFYLVWLVLLRRR